MGGVYFVTFGGPSPEYHNAVKRICGEAKQFQLFTRIFGYTDLYLKNDTEFWSRHGEFISSNSRGYGYWIWKSYLIKQQFAAMNDGDVIVYADAGCTLNVRGKARLLQYIDMCDRGIVSFQSPHIEKEWTKGDLSQYLGASQSDLSSGQFVGGIFLIRKSKSTVDLVDRWYDACCNYRLLDDSPSIVPNDPNFKENRHDQSIWSLLRKQYTGMVLSEETFFRDFLTDGILFPIWATRKI